MSTLADRLRQMDTGTMALDYVRPVWPEVCAVVEAADRVSKRGKVTDYDDLDDGLEVLVRRMDEEGL